MSLVGQTSLLNLIDLRRRLNLKKKAELEIDVVCSLSAGSEFAVPAETPNIDMKCDLPIFNTNSQQIFASVIVSDQPLGKAS